MNEETAATEVDYGPLAGLVGSWKGDEGLDVAPEPDGPEENPYHETITFEALGDLTNAGRQTLAIVRYQQIVRRKSNDEVFHDETGYWLWDAATATVMHSLAIPRAVCVLAGGRYEAGPAPGPIVLEVSARAGDPDWAIIESPFMRDNARTLEFRHKVTLDGDRLLYDETTMVEIYGKTFEHTDRNALVRA